MFRFLFITWLVLPQTQGASQIYIHHIQPFLSLHESQIETFVWNLRNKCKLLGLDYIARFLHYAKEYGAHYMMNTEVHPYTSTENGDERTPTSDPNFKSAYLDNFFSQFKQTPSPMNANFGPPDGTSTMTSANTSSVNYSTAGPGSTSSLFGAALNIGVSAIQSTIQRPKNYSNGARQVSNSDENASFISTSRSIDGQNDSRSVSGSGSTAGINRPKSRVPSTSNDTDSKASSNNSSDTDFDFVKHDDSSINVPDDAASIATGGSPQSTIYRRSSSWFKWRKTSSETTLENPAEQN